MSKRFRDNLSRLYPNRFSQEELAHAVNQEILRQARRSFDLYCMSVAASTAVSIIGGGLILADYTNEGALTAATGFGSIAYSSQMYKDAQEKLEDLLEQIQRIVHP